MKQQRRIKNEQGQHGAMPATFKKRLVVSEAQVAAKPDHAADHAADQALYAPCHSAGRV
jgi:hypothetical protein